jgi:uncharacterized protein (TIGR03437 family)
MRTRLIPALTLALAAGCAAQTAGWTLIGWNDLGMHCMDGDYAVYTILPPYNTIHAQLIKSSGVLVTNAAGITVTYEAVADPTGSINTQSGWKTNFWTFVQPLFGAALNPEMGLAGWAMPGANNTPQAMTFDGSSNWFTATGIPLTPYDDAGDKNYYSLMRLTARDSASNVLAITDIVLPVSDEMDCRACHASGSNLLTMPSMGWANDPLAERDYRWNILRLHDDKQRGSTVFAAALAGVGYSSTGLAASAAAGQPVLCASCHRSNALGTTGQPGVPPLTQSVHALHASAVDPVTGMTLDATENRPACYRCHPGSLTRCLRGVMGNAVAADGTRAIQCQSCHGGMSAVGAVRQGWLEEPACQSCHTGTAVVNAGQIRYTNALVNGQPRQATDPTFATNPNTPAAGLSLYRFSAGHGGLQCEACHNSTHAEAPSSHLNDNLQAQAIQGHAGTLAECAACHKTSPPAVTGGPHGLHPTGQSWVQAHASIADDGRTAACQLCHGTDFRGTVLSRATADRTLTTEFGTRTLFRGAVVGCYMCHNGPDSERSSGTPPVAASTTAATATGTPVAIALQASSGAPFIVSQPQHGTVALAVATATYNPDAEFEGQDVFTFASWDGSMDSNLAQVTITVTAASRPQFTAAGIADPASGATGAVAPGELVTIGGTGLGPAAPAALTLNSAGLVTRLLAGTRVLFDNLPAPVLYTSGDLAVVVTPFALAGRATTAVQVESNGILSAAVPVPVVAAAPGIFAGILNQDGVTLNSASRPAAKGSTVTLYASGTGALNRAVIDGSYPAAPLPQPAAAVAVTVAGAPAVVTSYRTAPNSVAGLLELSFTIPPDAPSGAQAVVLTVGGAASPAATVNVQ